MRSPSNLIQPEQGLETHTCPSEIPENAAQQVVELHRYQLVSERRISVSPNTEISVPALEHANRQP